MSDFDPVLTVYAYASYLVLSVTVALWVGQTLHRHGRIFLVDAFHGNEALADSINHLLLVGFYLINVGYVTLALKYGTKPHDMRTAVEFVSTKVGLVLLVLGTMHFINLRVFSNMRKRAILFGAPPPVRPQQKLASPA